MYYRKLWATSAYPKEHITYMDWLKLLPLKTVLSITGGTLVIWAAMWYLCDNEILGMQPVDFGKCLILIPTWVGGCILVAAVAKKKDKKTDDKSNGKKS